MDTANEVTKSLTHPPEKFDELLYFIVIVIAYPRTQRKICSIYYLHAFDLGVDYKLITLKVNYIFNDKGKIKSKKISKKEFSTDTTNHQFSISFEENIIPYNSILELIVEFSSQHFNSIRPAFNLKGNFERQLTFSVPGIFNLGLNRDNPSLELQSEKSNKYKLLNINRNTKEWDRIVEIFETDCKTYSWKVKSEPDSLDNITFELQGLEIPINIDIGLPRSFLYK